MALKIIEGVVLEVGEATPLPAVEGATAGAIWSFVRFALPRGEPIVVTNVMADGELGRCMAQGRAGRFAFYAFGRKRVLCGFADGETDALKIASAEQDPAVAATDVVRLPAKRKLFWGGVLVLTIIGIPFGSEMIKSGRKVLLENPKPKRPPDKRVAAALQGRWYWPF